MAHREHVSPLRRHAVVAACSFVLFANSWSGSAAPLPTESRGRVIDQDTEMPIAGALVVGKYIGSIAWAGASCDRIESAVSDQEGWFTIPTDSNGKPPFMDAYSRGYGRGNSSRHAFNGAEGDIGKWQVEVQRWDADNRRAKVLSIEPTIYRSQLEAEEASRERKDVYLRRFKGNREEYLMELRALVNTGVCGGGPQTSSGPIEFLEAIHGEQVALGESQSQLARTRDVIEIAIRDKARAQERLKAQHK
jgi:hypothetical protein